MAISYGLYSFPSPSPIVSIGDEPIYVNGEIDSSLTQIQLIGTITGSNLTALSEKKKELILELSKKYKTLDIEGNLFTFCKPVGVSFSDSDLTTILPYSVEFERYDEKTFSNYFGILDPTDSWSYQEQQNRLVQATHTVSAKGAKVSATDPLTSAKDFVNSHLSGFHNFSLFNPESLFSKGILQTRSEEIDRFLNSYAVTEVYSFSTSNNPIVTNGLAIIAASTQINYSKNQDSSTNISVNGSIIGDITGVSVTESLFSPEDAKSFASKSIADCQSLYEDDLYEAIVNGASSYSYETQEEANRINFSFQFAEKTEEILNDYSVSISASKDSNIITANVNGNITYNSHEDIYVGGDIESSPRYVKILAFFNSMNPHAFALESYMDFINSAPDYENEIYLNPTATEESTSKDPYQPSISYSFSYSNQRDNDGLKNISYQVTDDQKILKTEIRESNKGFAIAPEVKTLGKISVSASAATCGDEATSLGSLKTVVSNLLGNKTCHLIEEGSSSSVDSVSYNKTYYYS